MDISSFLNLILGIAFGMWITKCTNDIKNHFELEKKSKEAIAQRLDNIEIAIKNNQNQKTTNIEIKTEKDK